MKIAVVIPAVDEAQTITAAVESASVPGVDVLVVDGGSRDGTPELARAAGARVLACERGRARQLRAGVEATGGEAVLLLHADSRLAPGWVDGVQDALADPSVVGGAFRLRFDDAHPGFRLLEWGVRLRVALFGLPYGDQAIFARRRVLDAVGGVPEVPLMEDVDLVRALRRQGRLRVLPLPVWTSGRRHRAGGLLRTAGRHLLAIGLWRLGVSRGRIARWSGR